MKSTTKIIIATILAINILLRVIYILYGYIPSEEGMLIYGQKLAYLGLMPFIDYNAWNSLLNNYLVGWYQLFIAPTIITQRVFALILSSIVFFLVLYIGKNLKKKQVLPLSAFLLTFGSFTYLYYSTIPTSEQTMTLSLVVSFALISKTLNTTKHHLLLFIFSFLFAVLAFPIRPQSLPATFIIWLYIAICYRKELKKLFPHAKIILKYSNNWELLVSVILSAQCTDKMVNVVTKKLFKKYKTLGDYVRADIKEFEQDIQSTGFYHNKAKNILALSFLSAFTSTVIAEHTPTTLWFALATTSSIILLEISVSASKNTKISPVAILAPSFLATLGPIADGKFKTLAV